MQDAEAHPRPLSGRSAAFWSVLGEAATRGAAPLTYLVLARLLGPAEFGLAAVALVAVSLLQVPIEHSLPRWLVQHREPTPTAVDTAFWCLQGVAIILCAAAWLAAPALASAFGAAEAALAVRVQALGLLIVPLLAVQSAMVQRELGFRRETLAKLAVLAAPLLIALPLAVAGAGYLALVLGWLGSLGIRAMVQSLAGFYRPRLRWRMTDLAGAWRFAAWTGSGAILGWFFSWCDTVVVGLLYGGAELGLYRVGWMAAGALFGVIAAPLLPVLYRLLARDQDDAAVCTQRLRFALRLFGLLAGCGAGALMLGAGPAMLLLGPAWAGAAPVIIGLGLALGFSHLAAPIAEALRAAGRPDRETRILLLGLAIYALAYVIAWQQAWDFSDFLILRAALALGMVPLWGLAAMRHLGLGPVALLRAWSPGLAIGACCSAAWLWLPQPWSAALGGLVVAGGSLLLWREVRPA